MGEGRAGREVKRGVGGGIETRCEGRREVCSASRMGGCGGSRVLGGNCKEVADGGGNGNVRQELAGVAEDASGWSVCRVVFTGDILGADIKTPREGFNKRVDPFENIVGGGVAMVVVAPSFDDSNVVSEEDEGSVWELDGRHGMDE